MLPPGSGLPQVRETGEPMTFFFQVLMPDTHAWRDLIVSVFAATTMANENAFIPKMPPDPRNTHLQREFFEDYQTFFRLLVFTRKEAQPAVGYRPVLQYHKLSFGDRPSDGKRFGRIDKMPTWLLDDEAPRSFEAGTVDFLFQTDLDYEFDALAGAPRQKVPDYSIPAGGVTDRLRPEYSLFVANEAYYFGLQEKDGQRLIYVVPQS